MGAWGWWVFSSSQGLRESYPPSISQERAHLAVLSALGSSALLRPPPCLPITERKGKLHRAARDAECWARLLQGEGEERHLVPGQGAWELGGRKWEEENHYLCQDPEEEEEKGGM